MAAWTAFAPTRLENFCGTNTYLGGYWLRSHGNGAAWRNWSVAQPQHSLQIVNFAERGREMVVEPTIFGVGKIPNIGSGGQRLAEGSAVAKRCPRIVSQRELEGWMSNCPDFLRGCRATAGSQRNLTTSEQERITGYATELSDHSKCSYCGLVYARSASSARRLGWLDGIAGLGFKAATPAWTCS